MRNKRRLKQFSNDWHNLATSFTWKPFINDEDYIFGKDDVSLIVLRPGSCFIRYHLITDLASSQANDPLIPFLVASAKWKFSKFLMFIYFPLSTAEDFKQTLVTNCVFVICVIGTRDIRLIRSLLIGSWFDKLFLFQLRHNLMNLWSVRNFI